MPFLIALLEAMPSQVIAVKYEPTYALVEGNLFLLENALIKIGFNKDEGAWKLHYEGEQNKSYVEEMLHALCAKFGWVLL